MIRDEIDRTELELELEKKEEKRKEKRKKKRRGEESKEEKRRIFRILIWEYSSYSSLIQGLL